ncbi:MAG: twin-arginine translocase subunit TatC [Tissierellales bacterium]|nr:twin-arginine translocase subunit TatC [Tissierellales bacterium]
MKDVNSYSLVEHLSELRKRIIVILVFFILSSVASFSFIRPIMQELISIGEKYFEFIYLKPAELLTTYMRLAILVGIIISSPIIFLETWLFIKPGLERNSQKKIFIALIFGMIMFFVGVTFSYLSVLPLSIRFFGNMKIEGIEPMISISNYIGFLTSILLSFGIVFEMPVVIFILSKMKIVTYNMLNKVRKYVYLAIVILAAIITPPDVISQILLSIPMILLYEFSIFISKLTDNN